MTNFLKSHRTEKAMKRFNSGGYKRGGHVTEIEIVMGAPKGMKKSGMGCHKSPMRKAFGGPMDAESPQVQQSIDDANKILQNGAGLKRGGSPKRSLFKNRMCKADGGSTALSKMSNRDFKAGEKAMGLKKGGKAKPIRKSVGGYLSDIYNSQSPGTSDRMKSDAVRKQFSLPGGRPTGLKSGGDVRMAAGGIGKIRKHVMSKSGKPLSVSFAKKHSRYL